MIKITIPLIEPELTVFIGAEDLPLFDSAVKKKYPDWDGDIDADGMHCEDFIYIEDKADLNVVIHEVMHYLYWLFDYLGIKDEPEFQAHLASYILQEVMECPTQITN